MDLDSPLETEIDVTVKNLTVRYGGTQSWSSQPAVTFVLDDVSAITYDLVVNGSGVFVAHKANYVKTAIWTGAGDTDDPTDPDNWSCTDVSGQSISGCPCVLTEITVETPVTMNVPAGKKVYCKSITTTGTAALASDCDWRGFVKPTIAGTLDLAGYTLRINALRGDGAITDTSSGDPGELHVDVPPGVTAQNTSIVVSGNLKLVKDGEGSLALAKDGQSYTGGTDANEGTLVYGTGSNPAGSPNATVKVAAGATLDMNGVLNQSCVYNYDLAGTVLQYSSGQGWVDACRCFGDITLSGDATIKGSNFFFSNPTKATGLITFNGHTLTLNIVNADGSAGYSAFGAWSDEAEGGTLVVSGLGHTELTKGGVGCTRTRFVVTGDTFKLSGSAEIRGGFEYGSGTWTSGKGTPVLQVYGRYVALGAMRPRLNMHGGSTLDLSAMDVVWSADGIQPSNVKLIRGTRSRGSCRSPPTAARRYS